MVMDPNGSMDPWLGTPDVRYAIVTRLNALSDIAVRRRFA